MRGIINSLRCISDTHVQQTLARMDSLINHATATFIHDSPTVNGHKSYTCKIMDLHVCDLRVEFLGYLTDYMNQQDLKCLEVAQDTMVNAKSDFIKFYGDKVKASQVLSNINYSKLMMEVKWLLLNKPFNQ